MILCTKHYRLKPFWATADRDCQALKKWEEGVITAQQCMTQMGLNNAWGYMEDFRSEEDFVRFANSLGYWKDKRAQMQMERKYADDLYTARGVHPE